MKLKQLPDITWPPRLIVIRYIIILILIINHVVFRNEHSFLQFIILLIFMINNQLRFFVFRNRVLLTVSLAIDIVLIYILAVPSFLYFSMYFIISCFDTLLLGDKRLTWSFVTIFMVEMVFIYYQAEFIYIISNIGVLFVQILFMYQLYNEMFRVEKAQSLYDQLRIKENELVRLNKELEGYAGTVEQLTLLKERNRITQELHDSVGHRLSASIIQLGAIEKLITRNPDKAVEMVSNLREYNQESLQSVRDVINELKPKQFELYDGILVIEQLVKNYSKMTGVQVKMNIAHKDNKIWQMSEDQTFALYRIIQEALSNALRHGKATAVDLIFTFHEESLTVTIRDNGNGRASVTEGNGLSNMRQRLRQLGGELKYETGEADGFLIIIQLPKKKGRPT